MEEIIELRLPKTTPTVGLPKLSPEEQEVLNWINVVAQDRVCAMYGISPETLQAIINKAK